MADSNPTTTGNGRDFARAMAFDIVGVQGTMSEWLGRSSLFTCLLGLNQNWLKDAFKVCWLNCLTTPQCRLFTGLLWMVGKSH